MLMYSMANNIACFERSIFLKVNYQNRKGKANPIKSRPLIPQTLLKLCRRPKPRSEDQGLKSDEHNLIPGTDGAKKISLPERKTPRKANPLRLTPAPKKTKPRSDYELFNCNNFNIRYWSWNYRGCWHQTCPPMAPRELV